MKIYSAILVCTLLAAFANGDAGFGPGEQKWGYVTVREGAHMFWWLYYTTAEVENFTDRPLLIWLQGGPGSSSTGFGNFGELGPLDAFLEPRDYTWVKDANVLFIDNPVGTGFSYVEDASQLVTTNKQIAKDLVELLKGFLEALPEFKTVPIYILSESYGGKMAIEFVYEIDQAISDNTLEAQVLGVELGDSWISPVDSILTWAPYLRELGFVDQKGYDEVMQYAQASADAIERGDFTSATDYWSQSEGVVMDVTGGVDFYNILTPIASGSRMRSFKPAASMDEIDARIEVIMNGAVKGALQLNVTWGEQSGLVFTTLWDDFMRPVVDVVESVLNNTDVVVSVVTGQLDLIVDTPGTVKWVDEMHWWNKQEWERAVRTTIPVNGIIEGYLKSAGNLHLYWVNRAGHMVPSDNPAGMGAILERMTGNYGRKTN